MWSMPEPAPSLPVSVRLGDAYQPFRIPGVSVAVVVGVVWSTRTTTVCGVSALPPLSVDQYWTTCAPSDEIVNGAVYVCVGPPSIVYCVEATPESASVALSVTVTGETYQLCAPFGEAGERLAVVTGGVVSAAIAKSLLLTSKNTLPIASTLIRPRVVGVFGIVTESEPSFAVLASSTVGNVWPPSVDRLIFTFAVLMPFASVPATFQVTVVGWAPPTELGFEVTRNGPVPAASVSTVSSLFVPPFTSRAVKRMLSRGGVALFDSVVPTYAEVGRNSE